MAKKNDGRVNEVRRIFQKLYPNATSNEVAVFYHWLEDNGPTLLPTGRNGDSFLQLKLELQGLWGRRAAPVKLVRPKRARREA